MLRIWNELGMNCDYTKRTKKTSLFNGGLILYRAEKQRGVLIN